MLQLGSWSLGFLDFGLFRLDGGAMFGVVPRPLWEKTNPPDEKNRIVLAMRGLVLKGHGRAIVIDAGVGDAMGDKLRGIYAIEGNLDLLRRQLKRYNLQPEDVTDCLLTHLHFDHAAGIISRDGQGNVSPTFPKARFITSRRQYEHAMKPLPRDRASYLCADLKAVASQMEMNLIEGPCELYPELQLRLVDGHTFGQVVPIISGGGRTLCYPADLVPTSSHVKVAYHMGYDLQPLVIMEEKEKLLHEATVNEWFVAYEHDPMRPLSKISRLNEDFFVLEDDDVAEALEELGE